MNAEANIFNGRLPEVWQAPIAYDQIVRLK